MELYKIGTLYIFLMSSFALLGFKINAGNSPGVILTIVWCLMLIFAICLPKDIAESSTEIVASTDTEGDNETTLSKAEVTATTYSSFSSVIFLYYFIFSYGIRYNIINFYFPLLLKRSLGLGLLHVKLGYLDSALLAFTLYIVSYLFLGRYSELNILLVDAILSVLPIITILYFALNWDNNLSVNAAYLLLLAMFVTQIQTVCFPLTCSLLSQLTPVENATFYQSLSFAISHLTTIVSRVIGGVTFGKIPMMCVCLLLAVNWIVEVSWFSFEYKKIQESTSNNKRS